MSVKTSAFCLGASSCCMLGRTLVFAQRVTRTWQTSRTSPHTLQQMYKWAAGERGKGLGERTAGSLLFPILTHMVPGSSLSEIHVPSHLQGCFGVLPFCKNRPFTMGWRTKLFHREVWQDAGMVKSSSTKNLQQSFPLRKFLPCFLDRMS